MNLPYNTVKRGSRELLVIVLLAFLVGALAAPLIVGGDGMEGGARNAHVPERLIIPESDLSAQCFNDERGASLCPLTLKTK
jgi:hypothetical protein